MSEDCVKYAFVQTDGEGGDVLRTELQECYQLAPFPGKRTESEPDIDVVRRLRFVWIHNSLQWNRIFNACQELPTHELPYISRLTGAKILDNKLQLKFLCRQHQVNWMPDDHNRTSLQTEWERKIRIIKPANKTKGRGIRLVRDVELEGGLSHVGEDDVTQVYIRRPRLLFQKYKFDCRVYCLVVARPHTWEAFYHDGYLRRCAEPYRDPAVDPGSPLEDNVFAHLSNWNMANHHPCHDADSDCVNGIPVRLPMGVFPASRLSYMRMKMQLSMVEVVRAYIKTKPKDWAGQFALFGVDYLFDEDWGCWMLEWNVGPGIRYSVPFLRKLHRRMLRSCLSIVLSGRVPGAEADSGRGCWPPWRVLHL
mmetsp:Transcript_11936/g.36849  ORF Transcript_11936/g.36849 Transcript_11936/m.36849 type:complete len:365 (+) Transcript_11936:43-1137(+)